MSKTSSYDPFTKAAMDQVLKDLDPIELNKYNYIQENLSVNDNQEYKNKFMDYYCIKIKDRSDLREVCFLFWEQEIKNIRDDPDRIKFSNILKYIIENTEIDFRRRQPFLCFLCSNLIHTLAPDHLPVWGSQTLKYFELDEYLYKDEMDLDDKIDFDMYDEIYSQLKAKSKNEITQDRFIRWKNTFDEYYTEKYPEFIEFADIKKLDLFFWKYRHNNTKYLDLEQRINYNSTNISHVGHALLILRYALLLYFEIEYEKRDRKQWNDILEGCILLFEKGYHFKRYSDIIILYNENIHPIEYQHLAKYWDVMPLFELFEFIKIWNPNKDCYDNIKTFNQIYTSTDIESLKKYRNKWAHQGLLNYRNKWNHQEFFSILDCQNIFKLVFEFIENLPLKQIKKLNIVRQMIFDYCENNNINID